MFKQFQTPLPSFLSKVTIKKWGIYVFLSLGLVMLILFGVQVLYFGVIFDKNYFANLVNSLLPNVLSIFIAIYVVDFLNKKREENILQATNKSNAESIYFTLGRLISKILVYLDVITQEEVFKSLQSGRNVDFTTIIEKFKNYTDQDLFKMLNKKLFSDENYESFLKELKKIIESELKILNDISKNIYPVVDPEVAYLFNIELPSFVSAIYVTTTMLAMPSKKSFQDKAKELGEDVKKFKDSLTHLMPYISPAGEKFIHLRRSIINITYKAKENKLFLQT